MSTLDKMLIKGIRSFNPENTHVITFYKPLTLIVGPNGAGKTTIIECLKHACTGELPPNARSGHSFVHDPKIAGETETKGQIKLRFKTAAGKDVVCIRSFQLIQKASKLEYKAIESVLQTINSHTGEKVCLSYRCADMDKEVPALMGVSKAILENVIFVHQDEANWPLAEAAVLKKKFDDIFSATRYTKALDVIKKLHKDQAQEIKMYKLKLENLQTLKDAAYKLHENIEGDQDKAAQLKSQIHTFEKKIGEIQLKINCRESSLKQMRNLQDEMRTKGSKREMLLKLKNQQYADLQEENEDTDEELADWQAKFAEKIGALKLQIGKSQRELDDVTAGINVLNENIRKDSLIKGKLQAEADAYTEETKDRDSYIEELFQKYNLGGVGSLPLSEDTAILLRNRLVKRFDEIKEDGEQLKKLHNAEIMKLWRKYEEASKRCSELNGQIKGKLDQKKHATTRLGELHKQIEDFSISEDYLRRIEEKANTLENEVNALASKLNERDFGSIIDAKKTSKFQLEQRIKALRREKDGLASESDERVQLKLKREELAGKERSLNKIMDDTKEKVKKILKCQLLDARDLKQEVDATISKCKEGYDKLSQKSLEAEKEVARVSSMLEEARSSISKHQRDKDAKKRLLLSRLSNILQLDVDIEAYPTQFQEAIEKKEVKKSQHDMADGMRRMFEPFERVARASHTCPCCERPFTPEEEDEFVKKQRMKSSSTGERLRELASQFSVADTKVQYLEKLRPIYEEYQKITSDLLPAAEKLEEKYKIDFQNRMEDRDDILGLLAQSKAELEAAEELKAPSETADRLRREVQNLRSEVEEQEYKLNTQSQCLRTADDIQSELAGLEEKLGDLDRALEKLNEEQMHLKDDWSARSLRWHVAREEKMNALNKLTTLNSWKDEHKRLEEQMVQIDVDIQAESGALAPSMKEEEMLLREHNTFKAKMQEEEEGLMRRQNEFKQELDKLGSFFTKIQQFLGSGKIEKLKMVNDKLSQYSSQIKDLERRKDLLSSELSKSHELLRSQDQVKRNIDDNINYRKTLAEEKQLEREIEAIEEQAITIGELTTLEADLKKVLADKQTALNELNRNQGTLAVYESNVAKNKLELKQPQFKDINKRYRAQLIQLKTTEMANKDLDKYYNALDRALMRFHTMKMEEINKIIKEIWQQTYRGHDIDSIEIRADAESAGARSYSYRVVMRTGDAELDMRGRCSAGQKVFLMLDIICFCIVLLLTYCSLNLYNVYL
ncbi:hypothetical protein O6H91_08G112800 [Diphasiastrum complanatum]|uniref:Uncharacterized protein n=1 Tax=Diphasiastrum complanatum TaxID=34168 RepID=A0ACC2D102_DIPCM|nr:hypothetical protein O6H91_08G112800 [Diphasiastrum complanatum]